jgi:hypothetical protein
VSQASGPNSDKVLAVHLCRSEYSVNQSWGEKLIFEAELMCLEILLAEENYKKIYISLGNNIVN